MAFHKKPKYVQRNACLATTYTVAGTSQENLYQKLGL